MTEEYEAPQATRANDANTAHGGGCASAGSTATFAAACAPGSSGTCYRGDDPGRTSECITGKTAAGCYSGAGV